MLSRIRLPILFRPFFVCDLFGSLFCSDVSVGQNNLTYVMVPETVGGSRLSHTGKAVFVQAPPKFNYLLVWSFVLRPEADYQLPRMLLPPRIGGILEAGCTGRTAPDSLEQARDSIWDKVRLERGSEATLRVLEM